MKRLSHAIVGSAMLLVACSTATDATPSSSAATPIAIGPITTVATTPAPSPTALSAPTVAEPPATTTSTTTTTSSPATSTTLPGVWWLADDLFCLDLHALGYAYPEAALYWSIFETPDRMDADRNGIPCETVYPQAEVTAFWGEAANPRVTTIAEVAAWIQRWYDDAFVRDNVPDEITGPLQIRCADSWSVGFGDVFVCLGVPQTKHPNSLETASLLILVLDQDGKAIWSPTTSGPDNTAGLRYAYWNYPKGLSCDDLVARNAPIGLFSGDSRPPDDAFFYAMVYWSLEGRPSYMDRDGNGIPCEKLTSAENVAKILQGGPVPLYVRGAVS